MDFRVELHLSEQAQYGELPAALNVFLQGFVDGGLLRLVTAGYERFVEEPVIDGEVKNYLVPRALPLVTSFCTRQLMSSPTQISSSDGHAMP